MGCHCLLPIAASGGPNLGQRNPNEEHKHVMTKAVENGRARAQGADCREGCVWGSIPGGLSRVAYWS